MKYKDKSLEPLTVEKNTKNIQTRTAKSFGYQVLGFGSGGKGPPPEFTATNILVSGGGGGGGRERGGGGGGAGGRVYTSQTVPSCTFAVTIGSGSGPGSQGSTSTVALAAGSITSIYTTSYTIESLPGFFAIAVLTSPSLKFLRL